MTLLDFFKSLSLSGWTSLIVVVCMLIEITPIKVNPVGWLGERLNAKMYQRVDKIEAKLDAHIADGYRNYILDFQRKLVHDKQFTMEEWNKAISTCSDYEIYCKENEIKNDVVSQAIIFIKAEHQEALRKHDFLELTPPTGTTNEKEN